jgi:hypothetical protein
VSVIPAIGTPSFCALDAVDVDEQLRRVGGKRREHLGQSRRLARRADQFVGRRGQHLRAAALAVLDPHGEAAAGADAGHRGRRDDDDEGALDARQPLAQIVRDRQRGQPFLWRSSGSSNTGNSAAALLACVRVAPENPANAATRMMPGVSSAIRSISTHDLGGARQRRRARQLHRDDDVAAVLRRNETLRRGHSSHPALPISAA